MSKIRHSLEGRIKAGMKVEMGGGGLANCGDYYIMLVESVNAQENTAVVRYAETCGHTKFTVELGRLVPWPFRDNWRLSPEHQAERERNRAELKWL